MIKNKTLSTYLKQNPLNSKLVLSIASLLFAARKECASLFPNEAYELGSDIVKELFNDQSIGSVAAPLSANRDGLEDFCAKIELDLTADRSLNLMRQYQAEMKLIHQFLTLKTFLEHNQLVSKSDQLKRAEQSSAEVLIHAFNIVTNYSNDLSAEKSHSELIRVLDYLVIKGSDYGDVAEVQFGTLGLNKIADLNAMLFKILALQTLNNH